MSYLRIFNFTNMSINAKILAKISEFIYMRTRIFFLSIIADVHVSCRLDFFLFLSES